VINLQKPAVSERQQQQDAPHQVVDVVSVNFDPVKWTNVMDNRHHQQTQPEEGDEEAYRGVKHPAARAIRQCAVNDMSKAGEMKQQEHYRRGTRAEEQQDRRTGKVHEQIKSCASHPGLR